VGVRAAHAEAAAVEHRHPRPGLGQVVRAARPDHPATDDDHSTAHQLPRTRKPAHGRGRALGSPTTRGQPRSYFFGTVVRGKSSVRNGVAGSPSLLEKFSSGLAKFTHPYRTATGLVTLSQVTTTVSPLISAFAGWNTLSSPATANPCSSPPLAVSPPPVWSK